MADEGKHGTRGTGGHRQMALTRPPEDIVERCRNRMRLAGYDGNISQLVGCIMAQYADGKIDIELEARGRPDRRNKKYREAGRAGP